LWRPGRNCCPRSHPSAEQLRCAGRSRRNRRAACDQPSRPALVPRFSPAHPPAGGDLLRRMTLEEKFDQMTQTERGAIFDDPSLIAEWQVGWVLSGGGSTPPVNEPEAWLDMIKRVPGAGADHPPAGPDHLRDRRRPRARHRAGSDDLSAQRWARSDPRSRAPGEDQRGDRRGDAWHRRSVELSRPLPVRHP
jgi:hypothetical protein